MSPARLQGRGSGSGARSGSARLARLGLAALGIAALGLTSCSAPGSGLPGEAEKIAELRLHPSGPRGAWFEDGFANGAALSYATANRVCGISGNVVVEYQLSPAGESIVLARSIERGDVIWQIAGALCDEDSVATGQGDEGGAAAVLVRMPEPQDDAGTPGGDHLTSIPPEVPDAGSGWQLRRIENGAKLRSIDLETDTVLASVIPASGDPAGGASPAGAPLVVFSGEHLIGYVDGERAWDFDLPANPAITPLADGVIGIQSGLDDRLIALDGRTGDTLLDLDTSDLEETRWASDGYVVRINQSDPEYAFYDLTGAEVERTKGVSQYPFAPRQLDGVTFTLADHVAAGRVVGVAADGSPALFQSQGQKNYSRTQQIKELPDSILSVRGVSASGGLFLYGTDTGFEVIDSTGATVASSAYLSGAGATGGAEVDVVDGRIVAHSGAMTLIYSPVS